MSAWQLRAVSATRDTQLGAILHAVLGLDKDPPCFSGKAAITSDGYLMANFTDREGRGHSGAFVGSVEDLERNVFGLSAHLTLSEADQKELFDAVKAWIGKDWRSTPGLNLKG